MEERDENTYHDGELENTEKEDCIISVIRALSNSDYDLIIV